MLDKSFDIKLRKGAWDMAQLIGCLPSTRPLVQPQHCIKPSLVVHAEVYLGDKGRRCGISYCKNDENWYEYILLQDCINKSYVDGETTSWFLFWLCGSQIS